MAAYAAAISLMHILDLIKNHPSPPISLDRQQVDSLTQIVTFLQEFLESYVSPFSNSDEADPLEVRIADAAHAAEDVIESYIVDNIHHAAATTTTRVGVDDDVMESYTADNILLATTVAHDEDEQICYINFYEGLQKVIEAMDLLKKEAMGLVGEKRELEAELKGNISGDARFRSSSSESKSSMVGFEDELLELKERLVRGDSNRQIIPIVGMGGIGKTTLARKVFGEQLITEHFDICVWATISQDYNILETLSEVLSQTRGTSRDQSEGGLGQDLHKYLFGRRYLVVLDDMWSIEVWDKMRSFFPDCGKGSRIIVTTRMSNLAAHLSNSNNSLCMSFLNEVDSWTLFSKTVFGDGESFPHLHLQLREIGEKIVRKCKGLPLSIAVIGGLLSKSEHTQEYWEHIAGNLNAIVNLENEEYCLRVLRLSYNNLPMYLKPCFLYMGVFDEDLVVEVSTIIKLWVSEGFLKPVKKKSLETMAREYFQELVDRNLVLVVHKLESRSSWDMMDSELGSVGNAKQCKMHDLLRDLSLREAKKQRFYHVVRQNYPPPQEGIINSRRRIVIAKGTPGKRLVDPFEPTPHVRSFLSLDPFVRQFPNFKLLRTLHTTYRGGNSRRHEYSQADVSRLVNSRLLAIAVEKEKAHRLVSSISQLWSLHTLIVYSILDLNGPIEFWDMHQLKHVEFTYGRLILQLPLHNNNNNIVILENLHTLIGMKDFHLNEDVVTRIPNVKILDATYEGKLNRRAHSMSYLQCLSKLESFRCFIQDKDECYENLQKICFPRSLKQIFLKDSSNYGTNIELENILQKVGWLPLLEELGLWQGFFIRGEWETSEGQFPRLKVLEQLRCHNLRNWTVSGSSCFPLLQKLILHGLEKLEEIPSEIGEIATLTSIELIYCSRSAVVSAKKIVEEQEELYGEEELSFRVLVKDEAPESFASTPNFQVRRF